MFNSTNRFAPETPTTEKFIPSVMERKACSDHGVPVGVPCWPISLIRGTGAAICNKRAKRAGFHNKISEKALRLNRSSSKKR